MRSGMVAEIKANAYKFGVELTDEQAMTNAWEMDTLQGPAGSGQRC